MKYEKTFVGSILLLFFLYFLNSCGIYRPVIAKDYPPEPEKRVAKNIEEGRGFRLSGGGQKVVLLILQAQMNYGELHLMWLILCH